MASHRTMVPIWKLSKGTIQSVCGEKRCIDLNGFMTQGMGKNE